MKSALMTQSAGLGFATALNAIFSTTREWTRFFPEPQEAVPIIADENDEREWEAKCEEAEWRRENGLGIDFALPGRRRPRERPDNPRNLPCPSCDTPNRLTRQDRALGYQCDTCADKAERGCD